jgi:hypothetical protein
MAQRTKQTLGTTIAVCRARAETGQTVADSAITVTKSRRRIAFTKAETTPNRTQFTAGICE